MSDQTVVRRLLAPLALGAPFAYLGVLLVTAVHEVCRHGLTCLAVGGQFRGFVVCFDGMGWAYVTPPRGADYAYWKVMAVLLGGVMATTVFGAGLLAVGFLTRKKPWLAVPAAALSLNLLLEGPPYAFWNAVHPVPPGDLARLASTCLPARIILIALGGALMVAAIWLGTALLFWLFESWPMRARQLVGRTRALTLLLFGVVPGAMWFMFDWDQLAPGLGMWPNAAGIALHILAALSLHWVRWPPRLLQPPARPVRAAIVTGWAALAASVTAVALWLRP